MERALREFGRKFRVKHGELSYVLEIEVVPLSIRVVFN